MSRIASLILAAVLGGVVVGAVVWFGKQGPAATPSASPPVATTPSTEPPRSTGPSAPAAPELPPWAAQGDVPGSLAAARTTPLAGEAAAINARRQQRDAIRQRVHELTANGRQPTLEEMDVVLADLERVEGPNAAGGMDIAALRQNLAAVRQLQQVSDELVAESQKPGGGDEQKLNRLLEQLKQIQADMRPGVQARTSASTQGRDSQP